MDNLFRHLFGYVAVAIWVYAAVHQTLYALGIVPETFPAAAPAIAYAICAWGAASEFIRTAGERE